MRLRIGVAGIVQPAELVRNGCHRQPQSVVDGPHPARVAAGQVVVHGHQVDPAAGQGVEIHRQRGDQRFPLPGPHLGDLALVQHHAPEQLHVEVTLPERAPRRLAHHRERLREEIIERLPRAQPLLELGGLSGKRLVGERGNLRLQRVGHLEEWLDPLKFARRGIAQQPRQNATHSGVIIAS